MRHVEYLHLMQKKVRIISSRSEHEFSSINTFFEMKLDRRSIKNMREMLAVNEILIIFDIL